MLTVALLLLAPPVKPTVTFDAVRAKSGATVKVTARVAIPEGWHAYQNPPKSEYQNPLKLALGKTTVKAKSFAYPKGKLMTAGGEETLVYEGRVAVPFRVTVPKTAKPGTLRVPVRVEYQLCSDTTCLPPSSTDATMVVTVVK